MTNALEAMKKKRTRTTRRMRMKTKKTKMRTMRTVMTMMKRDPGLALVKEVTMKRRRSQSHQSSPSIRAF